MKRKELRSRKCFFLCGVFRIPMLSIYDVCTFDVHFTNVGIYFERLVQAMEGERERKHMLSIYEVWTFHVHFTYSCMAMLQCDIPLTN